MYVDSVIVPPLNVDRQSNPLHFWTMERLRSRERAEINSGGFGTGTLRGLYIDFKTYESDDEHARNNIKPSNDLIQPNDLTV